MGLRLDEALTLQVGDIDAGRKLAHIRRGKGNKDRMVPLPDLTLLALRTLWRKHQHPKLIFPNAIGSFETIKKAKSHMDRGGAQKAMKIVVQKGQILWIPSVMCIFRTIANSILEHPEQKIQTI